MRLGANNVTYPFKALNKTKLALTHNTDHAFSGPKPFDVKMSLSKNFTVHDYAINLLFLFSSRTRASGGTMSELW